MTKIKLCGLSCPCDIETANELKPEYIGFVFASKSKRYITPEKAANLKRLLNPNIKAVGVFVDETPENIACLLNSGTIDICQLHGSEDEAYHSLAADADTIPEYLKITALTTEGEVMAVQHKDYPIYGVQFHPESIMTPDGKQMLRNFIKEI